MNMFRTMSVHAVTKNLEAMCIAIFHIAGSLKYGLGSPMAQFAHDIPCFFTLLV